MSRTCLALSAAALMLPGTAGGQWIEAIELGGLGRAGFYDADVGLDGALGMGGRLGAWLGPAWGFEFDWVFQAPRPSGASGEPGLPSRARVAHDLFGLRLLYTRPVGERVHILGGMGMAYDRYYREREVGVSGGGPSGLLGIRFRLAESLSFRLEGTGYRVGRDAHRTIPRPATTNLGLQAGLVYTFRGRGVERIVELPPPPPDTVLVVGRIEEEERAEAAPVRMCLASGENVTVHRTRDGEILVGEGRVPLTDLGPGVGFEGTYAAGAEWFQAGEPPALPGRDVAPAAVFRRAGPEADLDCDEIEPVGSFRGVPLFAPLGAERPYDIVLVPVRPGIWQAYRATGDPGDRGPLPRPEDT